MGISKERIKRIKRIRDLDRKELQKKRANVGYVLIGTFIVGLFSMSAPPVAGFCFIVFAFILYFLPSLFVSENHKSKSTIQVLNLFFGWTLLGWVLCLAWSMSRSGESEDFRDRLLLAQLEEESLENKKAC